MGIRNIVALVLAVSYFAAVYLGQNIRLKLFVDMNPQIVRNIGLYFVCYELSKRSWNVMPTARNAKGVDIIAYNIEATKYIGVQVKALRKKNPVPLGNSLDKIMGDFWIIVNKLDELPGVYILKPEEVKKMAHKKEKDGRISYWHPPKSYMTKEFENRWDRIKIDAQ